jgi:hypothetical protein
MSKRFPRIGWIIMIALLCVSLGILPACGGGEGEGEGEQLLMRVATSGILTEPWNPIAGSNWVYDRFIETATQDMSVIAHPINGLYLPWRIEKAEVTVATGLPVGVTVPNDDWLTLTTASPNVTVPSDAWFDWDATTKEWIPAGVGKTALTKTVVYYPASIWNITYHDGSFLSPADFMIAAIMWFDRAKPASPLYDASYVAAYDAFMAHFKGVKFEFNTGGYGLIVTTWDDTWYLDAEWIVGLGGVGYCWYPITPYGELNFENMALGILAETNNQLAFSDAKATNESCEWLSFIGGPSLNILNGILNNVTNNASPVYRYIPYAPTVGDYITQEQALTRYQNLKTWYSARSHFWVGTGPYYVHNINTSGKVVDLKKYTGYNMPGDLFMDLVTPAPTGPWPNVTGGWLDEIVMSEETSGAAAITKLANNELDVYAYGLTVASLLAQVEANPDLDRYLNVGSFNEFTFNPAGNDSNPFFSDGRFNPMALKAIREALNKAVDRDYIANSIMGGLGTVRYTAIGTASKDYLTFDPELDAIATAYAYNLAAANTTIYNAMMAIPLMTFSGSPGRYYYNGTLVNVHVLIRTEDERQQMGEYLATQLATLGFDVTTQLGTSGVLSPIWRGSDPDLGLWNAYTGGWVSTSVSLDEGSNFGAFYTPLWAAMGILWQHYTPTPAFQADCDALWYNSFTTIPERTALFQSALPQSMNDSVRIFLVDRNAFQARRADTACAADAAGGIYGSYMWAVTMHFQDATGVPLAPAS